MFKFEVPSLTVGTLDTLMVSVSHGGFFRTLLAKFRLVSRHIWVCMQTLSDDLVKTDTVVESIVRKIERTSAELFEKRAPDLTVGGVPSQRYIQQFAWDSAKYPNRRPLKELVSLIAGGAAGIDEELKQLSQSFADKQQALNDAKRKKGGNLMQADLNDVLNEDIMRKVNPMDTEYLKTVFVAIPKSQKENFESSIDKMAADLVGYGGPDWIRDPTKLGQPVSFGSQVDRHQKRGSPVVPGSALLVHSDDDTMLYAVTILKSQYAAGYFEGEEFQPGTKIDFEQEFANACREKRYVLREFKWDPSSASKSAMVLEQLQVEVDGMKSALMRWCKTHYGDAFVAWMHIKVIRVFVESVLRYGLPVDFTAVLYKVHPGKDVQLTQALDKTLGNATDDGLEDDGEEYHDFVLLTFDP
jgi:V-type H+-transporting ATPase subunit C